MSDAVLAEFADPFGHLTVWTVLLRLVAAVLFGAVIGWERERRDKPAGLRTHILIAVAACLFTLIAFDLLDTMQGDHIRADPLRLIEAVTAGVAFLAAGAIIKSGGSVHGLTTGAGMWLAGAMGLAAGSGRIVLAGIAALIALVVLWLMRRIERALFGGRGD